MKRLLVPALLAVSVLLIIGAAMLWTPDRSRAELERLYLNQPADYLDVGGVRLHVRQSGPRDAPVLVMLHGFGSSLHTWEPWAVELSKNYRVVRFDLPGSGLSPPDPTGDYRDERCVFILGALLDALGVERASLIGNSMGGKTAWQFAARHPAKVDKLVLVAPDGFASPGFEYNKAPDISPMVRLMRYSLPKPLVRMSLAPAYGDPANLSDSELDRYYDLLLAPGARDAMLAKLGQTMAVYPVPMLEKITAPTLLLWGEKDAMIPFANSNDYLKALRDARRVSFPALGHVPHEEAPGETLPPVLAFLRDANGRASGAPEKQQ